MEENLSRISPTAEDGLDRQTPESYIEVCVDVELELRHFKAILYLSSLSGVDLSNPNNARAASRALDGAIDLLSQTVLNWQWLDRKGEPIADNPADNTEAFGQISMREINWMIESVSGLISEVSADPGN